ncbi:hypothetical protein [Carboxylicivirga sp. RSCT41]|uniref:hypothetical protein n=1 Tax=Carboxylicivirga agarovorans TaxID=3417570 RepID=UPI003D32D49B
MVKITQIIIIFLFMLSCAKIENKNNLLIGYEKDHSHRGMSVVDTVRTQRIITGDSIFYVTQIPKKNHVMKVRKSYHNDSILVGQNVIFELHKTKVYKINGANYTVYKYVYNDEQSSDEEEDIFFTDEYGVLYDRLWWFSYGSSYEYDLISTKLVEYITSDTTGFFKEKILPPPPKLNKDD